MARMCQLFAVVACLAMLTGPAHARALAKPDPTCETCLLSMHVLDDIMCDPFVDDQATDWLVANVCSQMGQNKESCIETVTTLLPAAIEWLRANLNPDGMCANVCPKGALAAAKAKASPRKVANDATCSLCMYVVGKVKEVAGDETTQDQIHDRSIAACYGLPEGPMRDSCVDWVDQYEGTIFKYVNTMEPEQVCQRAGTCLASAVARGGAAAPLDPAVVAALSKLAGLAAAPPSNDNCETCKMVIQEIHQVVANPDMQQQIIDYAKQACTVVTSVTATCQADVDQYAPMVFGMVLAYLQPEQVCEQIKICPAPSVYAHAQAQVALTSSMAAAKFRAALAGSRAVAAAKVATS